jgi:probable phosphoglycerate mutase
VKLYFARHGESEANVQQVFWNQPEGYGLTDKGREQARALADHLAGIACTSRFAGLYCSPVLRAVQTAGIVGRRLDLTPEVADGLREWHTGILEGASYSEETQGLHWWVTEQWMVYGNHDARIEGGESFHDIRARFMPFIAGLEEKYRQLDACLLLISHGGTLRGMLPLLVSNLDNASVLHRPFSYATPIVVELRDGEWICLRWGQDVLPGG